MNEISKEGSDYTSWWATVRYQKRYGKDIVDQVPVTKISRQWFSTNKQKWKRKPFRPATVTDFERTSWYSVLTSKNVENGDEASFWALIGRLGESEEYLIEADKDRKLRISWPNIPDYGEEPPTDVESSSADVAGCSGSQQSSNSRAQKRSNKREAQALDFQTFMEHSLLDYDEENGGHSEELVTHHNVEESGGESVEALKERIRILEQQREENLLISCTNKFEEYVTKGILEIQKLQKEQGVELLNIRSTVNKLGDEVKTVQQACRAHDTELNNIRENLTVIGNSLSGTTASSLATVNPTRVLAPESDIMVKWADSSYLIRQRSLENMATATSINSWLLCFLYGIFEEKEVPFMVTCKKANSHPSVKEIDGNLLLFAKAQFRDWLSKLNKYSPEEIEHNVKYFGSYVGDITSTRRGPRGQFKKLKEVKLAGGNTTALLAEIKSRAASTAQTRVLNGELPRTRQPLGHIRPKKRKTTTLESPTTTAQVATIVTTAASSTPLVASTITTSANIDPMCSAATPSANVSTLAVDEMRDESPLGPMDLVPGSIVGPLAPFAQRVVPASEY